MSSDFLFVYGTLLKDLNNDMSKFLDKNAHFISKGCFHGLLYMVSWYPGAVLSNKKSDYVYGNIFKLKNLEILKFLDDYEGVGEHYPKPNLFKKELVTAYLDNNAEIKVWVYIFNHSVLGLKQIVSGDFLKFSINN